MSLFGLSATSVMRAQMQWDAENRLAAYIPLNPWSGAGVPARSRLGANKVTFTYDYRGRRIEKNVYAWNSGGSPAAWYTVPTERRRFIWSGAGVPAGAWLMLRETIETDSASDGSFEATRVKTYTWGKDLGGGIESNGGIGGLLAVYDDSATSGSTGDDLAYVYMYDANGNVGQVCDLAQSTASASIVAKYEYDAYGNAPVSTGSYATANTYRFSTKPWDDETGLGYWGYRYYDPRLGRWMSRDPIGELGGTDLYAYTANQPSRRIDSLGLVTPCEQIPKTVEECCARLKKIGLDQGAAAGPACCNERKVICIWIPRGPPGSPCTALLDRCVSEHEWVHFTHTESCKGNFLGRPKPTWNSQSEGECLAHTAHANCLTRQLMSHPECAPAIWKELNHVLSWLYHFCNGAPKPGGTPS